MAEKLTQYLEDLGTHKLNTTDLQSLEAKITSNLNKATSKRFNWLWLSLPALTFGTLIIAAMIVVPRTLVQPTLVDELTILEKELDELIIDKSLPDLQELVF